jgi:hypothetical protein
VLWLARGNDSRGLGLPPFEDRWSSSHGILVQPTSPRLREVATLPFREFHAARRTSKGYEAIHMLRKGQVRWASGADVRRQNQFINKLFQLVA